MSRSAVTLADLGEFAFLERLVGRSRGSRDIVVGPGHDCAAVRVGSRDWLLTMDSMVEGTHFRISWLTPQQLGRRAFAINASDIAAMGGSPRFALVNVALPPERSVAFLSGLQRGLARAAREAGASVVGGNLTSAPEVSVTVALVGEAPRRRVTRGGARPGDLLFVTGSLGDAAAAVLDLKSGRQPPAALMRRFARPPARIKAGQQLAKIASAMIDVSDGLVQDIGHICRRSGVGAVLRAAAVPVSPSFRRAHHAIELALSGGEDFELVCAVPRKQLPQLARLRRHLDCPLTEIGEICSGRGVSIEDPGGGVAVWSGGGYDHFRER